jgi:hypothetical protein
MWVTKPYITSNRGMKKFETMIEAVKYLELETKHEMSFESYVDKTTGEKRRKYDWEIVGKLWKEKD